MKLFGMLVVVAMMSFNASVFAVETKDASKDASQEVAAAPVKKHEKKSDNADTRRDADKSESKGDKNVCDIR